MVRRGFAAKRPERHLELTAISALGTVSVIENSPKLSRLGLGSRSRLNTNR